MGSAGGYAVGMRQPQFIQSELAPAGLLAPYMQEGDVMLPDGWQSQDSREPSGAMAVTPSPIAASARFSPGGKR
jgi:hypothetical protein